MSAPLRTLLLGLATAAASLAGPALAAGSAAGGAPPPQSVALRVVVGPDGKVQAAQPLDASMVPALLTAAQEISRKLTFTPATKGGRPVKSETTLQLLLGFEPRSGGGYGIALRRASNGPSVLEVGRGVDTKVSGKANGGLVVVGVDLKPDGTPDMSTFKAEKVELRVPSTFAEERFLKAAETSLEDTRFQLDFVDGIGTPSRISVPFMFHGGPGKRKPGEDPEEAAKKAAQNPPPGLTAVSKIEGVVLPKIDFAAPDAPQPTSSATPAATPTK